MSILIKGMEMPKVPTRVIIFADGRVEDEDDSAYKYSAVPVPPHGDLIDRERTLNKIRPWSPEDDSAACTFATVKKLMHTLLNDSPAIIPADLPKEE